VGLAPLRCTGVLQRGQFNDSLFTFSGSALAKRQRDREREIEADDRDRKKEQEEIDVLRKHLIEDNHPDPDAAIAKVPMDKQVS